MILCLAGSLISAGLKQIFVDLIRNNMVDAVVSTGANMVDQDFFEALGYKHWIADDLYRQGTEDATLRELMIDRIERNGHTRGQSGQDRDQTFSVRFTCCLKSKHVRGSFIVSDGAQAGKLFNMTADRTRALINRHEGG